ncbi:MAG: NAD(P)-dependent oxidoreductase [Candidatus Brocadiia bacterium]
MHILITGANRPLGRLVAEHLSRSHRLRLTGVSSPGGRASAEYVQGDLRRPDFAASLVDDIDAVVHLAEFDPAPLEAPDAEQERLERATLGTYRLCAAAREAGAGRIVVAGSLSVFDAYPDEYLVDEQWRPRPEADADHLAPYLCELVVREFAREGPISGVCLRFAPIGEDPETNTRSEDALEAIERALEIELGPPGYNWHVFHVASSGRFIERNARLMLGFEREGA